MKKSRLWWILKLYQYLTLITSLFIGIKQAINTSKRELFIRLQTENRNHFVRLKNLLIFLVSWLRSVFYKCFNCPIDKRNGFSICGTLYPFLFPHKFGILPNEWSIQSRTILVYFGGESGNSKQPPQEKEDKHESAKQTEGELGKYNETASEKHCPTSENEEDTSLFASIPEEPAHLFEGANCKSRKRKKESSSSENENSSETNEDNGQLYQPIRNLEQPSNTLPSLFVDVEDNNIPIYHAANSPLTTRGTQLCEQGLQNVSDVTNSPSESDYDMKAIGAYNENRFCDNNEHRNLLGKKKKLGYREQSNLEGDYKCERRSVTGKPSKTPQASARKSNDYGQLETDGNEEINEESVNKLENIGYLAEESEEIHEESGDELEDNKFMEVFSENSEEISEENEVKEVNEVRDARFMKDVEDNDEISEDSVNELEEFEDLSEESDEISEESGNELEDLRFMQEFSENSEDISEENEVRDIGFVNDVEEDNEEIGEESENELEDTDDKAENSDSSGGQSKRSKKSETIGEFSGQSGPPEESDIVFVKTCRNSGDQAGDKEKCDHQLRVVEETRGQSEAGQLHANSPTGVMDECFKTRKIDENEEKSSNTDAPEFIGNFSTQMKTDSPENYEKDQVNISIQENDTPSHNLKPSSLTNFPNSVAEMASRSTPSSVCHLSVGVQSIEADCSSVILIGSPEISSTAISEFLLDVTEATNNSSNQNCVSVSEERHQTSSHLITNAQSSLGNEKRVDADTIDSEILTGYIFLVQDAMFDVSLPHLPDSLPEFTSVYIPMNPAVSILNNILKMGPVFYMNDDLSILYPDFTEHRRLQGDPSNSDGILQRRNLVDGYPMVYFIDFVDYNQEEADNPGVMFRLLITPRKNLWRRNNWADVQVDHWVCFRGDPCDRQADVSEFNDGRTDVIEFNDRLIIVTISMAIYQRLKNESFRDHDPLCAKRLMKSKKLGLCKNGIKVRSSTIDSSLMTPTESTNYPLQLHPCCGSSIKFALTSNESKVPFYITLSSDGIMSLNVYSRFCETKSSKNRKPDLSTIPVFTLAANWIDQTVKVYESFANQQFEEAPIANETELPVDVNTQEQMNACTDSLNQGSLTRSSSNANKISSSGFVSETTKTENQGCGPSESSDYGNISNIPHHVLQSREPIKSFRKLFSVSRDVNRLKMNRLSTYCDNDNHLSTSNESSHHRTASLNKAAASTNENNSSLSVESSSMVSKRKSKMKHQSTPFIYASSCCREASNNTEEESLNYSSGSEKLSASFGTFPYVSSVVSNDQCPYEVTRLYYDKMKDWPNISGGSLEDSNRTTRGFVTALTDGESTLFTFSNSNYSIRPEFIVLINNNVSHINVSFKSASNFEYQIPRNVFLNLVDRIMEVERSNQGSSGNINITTHRTGTSAVSNDFDCSHYSNLIGEKIHCDHKEELLFAREKAIHFHDSSDKRRNTQAPANPSVSAYATTSEISTSSNRDSGINVPVDRTFSGNMPFQEKESEKLLLPTPRKKAKLENSEETIAQSETPRSRITDNSLDSVSTDVIDGEQELYFHGPQPNGPIINCYRTRDISSVISVHIIPHRIYQNFISELLEIHTNTLHLTM